MMNRLQRSTGTACLGTALALWTASAAAPADTNAMERALVEISHQVSTLERRPEVRSEVIARLLAQTDAVVQAYPGRAEPLLWKGIVVAMQANHAGFKALAQIREAKRLLEASLALDPATQDGAAYLTLAILYYKVPPWPLGYRDNRQAEKYFVKALAVSSHLDTHFRYGEFLAAQKRFPEARAQLQAALAFPDRADLPEDALKKEAIRKLLAGIKPD